MLTLRFLGGATIERAGRPLAGRAAQRHSLALLALLAAARGRPISRDKLVAYVWPDGDAAAVRQRLNVAVYELRKLLGRDAIVSVGDDLCLDTARVRVDLVAFEEAFERGDHEGAVALYAGPLLDGFHLSEGGEFEAWLELERDHLARAFGRALETLARDAEARGEFRRAARLWRRRSDQDPYSSVATLGLMRSLAAAGERAAALLDAERHLKTLAEELGAAPDPAVAELAERLRSGALPAPAAVRPPGVQVGAAATPRERGAEAVGADDVEPRRTEASSGPPAAAAASAPGRHEPRRLTSALPPGLARRVSLRGAAALAAAGLALVLLPLPWISAGRGGAGEEAAPPLPGRVVVLPFVVRGSDGLAYLGEGMAELLGTTLDGAGSLRTVDPRAVLSFVRQHRIDPGDPEDGRRVAQQFGAGHFVLGSVLESGGKLELHGALYRGDGEIEARTGTGAEGDGALFEMVDALTRDLLAQRFSGRAERLSRLAVATSASLPALKAYLTGEAALRVGRHAEAAEAFRRAVAEDSTFALAWYRLAVAAEWAFQPHVAEQAVSRAVIHAGRLPERERLLLVGWRAYARGEPDGAEAVYRRVVDAYPDEVEAWLQLGEIRFHYAPSRGRPFADSRVAFERVMLLEPDHEDARLHLARVAAREGDRRELERHVRHLIRRDTDSRSAREARALWAFAVDDDAAKRRAVADYEDEDSYATFGVLLSLFYAGSVDGVEAFAGLLAGPSRPIEVRTAGHLVTALTQLARGRPSAARAELDRAAALDRARAAELRALAATMPFLRADRREAALALAELARGFPRDGPLAESFFLPDHAGIRPLLRTYLTGLLETALGRHEAALRRAEELERIPPAASDTTLGRELAAGVRAEMTLRRGDPAAALAALERIRERPTYELVLPSPFHPRVRERFEKARLLAERGRHEEALRLYGTIGSRSVYDLPYRAPALHARGRLHERAGDVTRAADDYRVVLSLWGNADPELQPIVADARERLVALEGAATPP